jgi:hypothetical protein
MNCLKSSVALPAILSTALGFLPSAFGGVTGSVNVKVAPILSPAVATYSNSATGFVGAVGYSVDVSNVGKNTNNSVRFTAQSNVTDAAEFETYAFDSAEGVSCTASKGPVAIAIDCALGTLVSGQSYPTFYVFFKSPQFVLNGTADESTTDSIAFNYQVFYAEGGNGPKSTPKNGFTALTAAVPVVLGTPDPQEVRSVVLASGGVFFTGNQGIADPADIHATKTVVPPLTVHTTAEIIETPVACLSPSVVTCYQSQITIPGTFSAAPYLATRLTEAIQNIKTQTVTVTVPCEHDDDDHHTSSTYSTTSYSGTCTKSKTQLVPIDQVAITYLADASAANPNPLAQTVILCSPLAGPPLPGVPCITNRTVVNDLLGNPIRYEWTFISFSNGRLITGT